jgi:hypothetical protein
MYATWSFHPSACGDKDTGLWAFAATAARNRSSEAAVVRDPTTPAGVGQLGAIQNAAPSFGVELTLIDVRNDALLQP